MPQPAAHRVVIAGGGVAGLEALLALRSLAGDHTDVTLVSPDDEFRIRALTVREPFALPAPRRYRLADICGAHEAAFHLGAVENVDADAGTVTLASGEQLPYDSLLVAVGAEAVPAFQGATTFRGQQDSEDVHGIVQDVEGGYSRSIAFVVPTGVTWPVPLYELALMTAERAYSQSMAPTLTIVTCEEHPLGIFGRDAGAAVERALHRAGIAVTTSTEIRDVDHGRLLGTAGEVVAEAQRVVAAPRLAPLTLRGLPADDLGFVPIDDHGAVEGLSGVFAAGDGTAFPVKQGGIAAQQADAAARAIARRAGADVELEPFRPTLRAQLLTGTRSLYLREELDADGSSETSAASSHSLWWPPSKVAAPYLALYLERLDRGDRTPVTAGAGTASGGPRLHAEGDPAGGVDRLGG